ncbi:MAG: acetyl-CoA carboxylase biotin carboxyl carrier protein subunit [Planctomycetes bacterium]|nr:acetyl-CoA carboxylase biotin carboxyl carrier protein subunit [Planctomycetota bacterium]
MLYYTDIGGRERAFTFQRRGDQLVARCGDRTYRLDLSMVGDGSAFSMLVDNRSFDIVVEATDGMSFVQVSGEVVKVKVEDERERTAHAVARSRVGGRRTIKASMPGVVIDVAVAVGDAVEDGQTLLVLEAMKMQNPIQAEGAGKVVKVHVAPGDTIANGTALVDLDE